MSQALPPGPKSPAIWQLLRYTLSPLPFLESCSRRYGGPFTIHLAGFGRFVMMTDPEAIKDVFRGDPAVLHSGEGNEFFSVTVGKNSVLVLDREPHARQRRVLLPPLKGERMRAFFEAMQSATFEAVRSWPVNEPIRMLEWMKDLTLRVMLQVVLGVKSTEQMTDLAAKVRQMLAFGQNRFAYMAPIFLPLRLLEKLPWLPYFRQLRALDQSLFAFIQQSRDAPQGDTVVADLIAATHDDGRPLSDQEIRDALVTLIIAGHDTTSVGLAWALEQIVPRANVVARIDEELQRVTGGTVPRADQLQQLEYLDAVIRESLRVRTAVPFVVRLTKQPFKAGNREYPPGVLLCPCIHLTHRRPDLYPEPEKFRPERFLERRFAAHEWFPFGGGNRMCLGMAFALYEMKVVLSTLFASVRMERPTGARSNPVRRGIVLTPHDGARMIVNFKK
ncbi:MAG: cytochrome P450 [Gemmataceae bacterium]